MLKKEFFDASKKLMECLLLILIIPLAIIFDRLIIHIEWSFSDIFKYVFLVVLIIYPPYAGTTIFQSEKRDRAFEYLLSLPLSRLKIIAYKISPRILFLLALLVVSILTTPFKNILMNGFNLVVLFFVSLFLGVTFTSIIIGFIGIGLIFWLFYYNSQAINFIFYRPETVSAIYPNFPSQLISAALLLVPLGFSFWLTFKNLDVKPLKLQMKHYVYIALPSILVLISLTVLFYKKYWVWFQAR